MQATPATWRLLLEAGWAGNQQLKILCGGEALPRDLALRLQKNSKAVWNLYGPTETTIWSTVYRLSNDTPNTQYIPIGRPIANTQLYILDTRLQLVPIGAVGELHIGGDGLARGYLNRLELTAEKFIAYPFSDYPQARLYKTGDLARYFPDGTIEFLGRIDQQIKLRGFRIELGEIEVVLLQHPDVSEAIIVMREDHAEDNRLVAYIMPRMQADLSDSNTLRHYLKEKLPGYMLPSAFVILKAMPLTANGKLDRQALPIPEYSQYTSGEYFAAPDGELEQHFADLRKKILSISSVGRNDKYFH
jgi:acyl-coenzyme A synthetase/AMP-(fatty) acid ligase